MGLHIAKLLSLDRSTKECTADLQKLLVDLPSLRGLPVCVLDIVVYYVGPFPIRGKHVFTLKTEYECSTIDGSPTHRGEMFVLGGDRSHLSRVTAIGLRDHDVKRSWDVTPIEYYRNQRGMCVDSKTGHIFIVDTDHSTIQEMKSDGEFVRTITQDWFKGPRGIAIDSHRRLMYISNSIGETNVLCLETYERINPESIFIGGSSLFFDDMSMRLSVICLNSIMIINIETNVIGPIIGGWFFTFDESKYPSCAIISAGEVLVSYPNTGFIKVFSAQDGEPLYSFKHSDMLRPTAMYRNSSTGYLYVVGEGQKSIFVFE